MCDNEGEALKINANSEDAHSHICTESIIVIQMQHNLGGD